MEPLVDSYGRRIKSMRISITDKCNFRCTYCMPAEGLPWLKRQEILSYEEIARITQVAASIGIEQIRLTGGEPTVRRDLPELIRMLQAHSRAAQPEPDDQWRAAEETGRRVGRGRVDSHQCESGFAGAREVCPIDAPRSV